MPTTRPSYILHFTFYILHTVYSLHRHPQDEIRPSVWTYNEMLRGVSVAPQWHRSSSLLTDELLDKMEADEVSDCYLNMKN